MDFNLACALRLEIYDLEKAKTQARLIASEVSKMFGGGGEEETDYLDMSEAEMW